MVITGLESLKKNDFGLKGNIGYLCHAASVDSNYVYGIDVVKSVFGTRLKKLFSLQHGFFADVQDNIIESNHFHHGHHDLSVYIRKQERQRLS